MKKITSYCKALLVSMVMFTFVSTNVFAQTSVDTIGYVVNFKPASSSHINEGWFINFFKQNDDIKILCDTTHVSEYYSTYSILVLVKNHKVVILYDYNDSSFIINGEKKIYSRNYYIDLYNKIYYNNFNPGSVPLDSKSLYYSFSLLK